jgi:UDP-GlcNAc:undecaprenyl-phosphate GlcNAc-1-phosphate transferase
MELQGAPAKSTSVAIHLAKVVFQGKLSGIELTNFGSQPFLNCQGFVVMPSITLFYILISSIIASLIMIPYISRLAIGMGILDRPGDRRIHLKSTPRLGGIAIFFSFLLTVFLFSDIGRLEQGFLAGAAVVFLVGLADDLAELTPGQKLAGQACAALVAIVIGNFRLTSLGDLFGMGEIELGMFAVPFSVLAIVGVTNAVNLMDGLDGLAGGVSAIAAGAMAMLAFHSGNEHLVFLTVALTGAILGFLKYNTYPASIFMGDAGSLFLGYCMGTFSILLVTGSGGAIHPATPLIILAIPVLDTIYVICKRLKAGRSPFLPDNYHIHHRFLDLGVGHEPTVVIVYAFSYLMAVLAVFSHRYADYLLLVYLSAAYVMIYFGLRELCRAIGKGKPKLPREVATDREVGYYRRLVHLSRNLRIGVKYLIMAALALSLLVPAHSGSETAIVCLFLTCLSGVLCFVTNYWGNRFLLFILYVDGAFIVYKFENLARNVTIFDVHLLTVSHIIFFLLFLLVGAKIFLRNQPLIASTPLDYLLLFIVISTPLLPHELTSRYHLQTVAGKSLILFAAYKLVLLRQANRNRKIIVATMIALVAIALKVYLYHL